MADFLDNVTAKMERAKEHLETLERDWTTFTADKPYDVVQDFDAKENVVTLKAANVQEPPPRFGVIIGDAVHNLRSTLDHIVRQLVLANNGSPTHKHQFPICDTPDAFNGGKDRWLADVDPRAITMIEQAQPYTRSKEVASTVDVKLHFLAQLRDLSNTDKHRAIITTQGHRFLTEGLNTFEGLVRSNCDIIKVEGVLAAGPLEDGTQLARFWVIPGASKPNVEMKENIPSHIAFSDGRPVMPILEGIGGYVGMVLATLGKNFL